MTATDIHVLSRDAQMLDAAAFARRHGDFFFVSLGLEMPKTRVPMATHRWIPLPETRENTARVATTALAAAATPLATSSTSVLDELLVFPVRRLATSEFPFVSIGRLDGNDIALGAPTVSKFHAYLKADDDGAFTLLQDGRSQNGTFVDGQKVAQRHAGPPTLLVPGMNVRFGSVSLTYLDAATLMRLARNADAQAAAAAAFA